MRSGIAIMVGGLLVVGGSHAPGQLLFQYELPGNLSAQTPETNGLPVILRQPTSQVVSAGENGSFSVLVSDARSVNYQWRFNGSDILGSTRDSALLTNVTAASEGNYSVVVANSSGSVTSAPAILSWDSAGDGLPDSWKIKYFGTLNVTAASDAPLHDGIPNLQKFLDGINPTNGVGLKPRLVLSGLNGSVSASPDLDKYTLAQSVTLTATAHPGFQFVGWSGDLLGADNPAPLSMDTNKNITAVFSLPLSYTLDATNITWRSGGDVPWFGQDFVTYDGVAAAQNGPLRDNQESWLEGTVYMPAEGLLTFWSKRVPSAGSFLHLAINGSPQFDPASQFDWQKATYYLPAGTDVIRWTYVNGLGGSQGFDAYWVDQVAATLFSDQLKDSDLDGLPDLWEYKHFGDLRVTGTQDYDRDGVDNRQEFVDGTNPTDGTSVRPRLSVSTAGGSVGLSPSLPSYNYLQTVNLTANPSAGYNFIGWRGDLLGSTNPASLIMDSSKFVDANFALSAPNALGESLDATNLVWSVGGDASFFAQTLTSHDGVDAAQSPPLAPNQQAWFQTTVSGPAPLSFWWKTESSFGSLQFYINGVQKRILSGNSDWQQFTTSLTNGANTLRWVFVANSPATTRDDAGWVDQVTFGTNVPSITSLPISKTILQSSNVSFSVTASSSAPLSYRWQKNGINLSDGGSLTGATTSTLTLNNSQTNDSGTYSVLVSTASGTVRASASLNVIALVPLAQALDAPSWTWTSGGNAAFLGQNWVSNDGIDAAQAGSLGSQQQSWVETTLNGPGSINFWWKVSCSTSLNHFDCLVDGVTNASISGEVGWVPRSVLIPPGTHAVRWQYVQNYFSPFLSQSAWLDQVSSVSGLPPAITAVPLSQTVTGGVNVTFSVAATGAAPLSYQWLFDRTNFVGSNSSTLNLANVQLGNAGGYSVVISNALGKITSPTADLVVNVPPFVTAQPSGAALLVGTNVTLSVIAGGADPLYYQWRKDGLKLAGSTQPSLTINNVQTSDSGSYTVLITNWLGSVTSAVARVVVGVPPSITTQPTDQTVSTGSTATFSVVAAGTAPLYYQWRQNGLELPGKTAPALVLANVQESTTGFYDVVVSNALGSVTSLIAFLSIGTPSPPTIFVQPAAATVSPGGSVTLIVQAFGVPTPSYQWLRYATNLPGATDSTLQLTNVQVSDAGPYSVFVFNSAGSVTSQVATITVGNSSLAASLAFTNGIVSLKWSALVGRDYQVEFKNDLSASSWSNLPPIITATDSVASAVDLPGSVQRRYYRVELLPQANTPPTITVQPVSQTTSPGMSVSFSVTATGSEPLHYQWRMNGGDLPGKNSATLQFNSVQSIDSGVYDVVVSNSAGSVTSDSVFLLVF